MVFQVFFHCSDDGKQFLIVFNLKQKNMDIINHIKRKYKEHCLYECFAYILVKLYTILVCLKNKLKLVLPTNFLFLVLYEHCSACSFRSISQRNIVIWKEQTPIEEFKLRYIDVPRKQEAPKTDDNQTIYVTKHMHKYKGLHCH